MTLGTFALSLILASAALPAYGAKPPKDPKSVEPAYNTATVIDVMAKVTDVWEIAAYMPMEGLHLTVKSGAETFDVYVGPVDFVKIFGVTFTKGDRIEVIGSRVMGEGGDILLAREIRIYDVTMTLRDKDGTPYWRDWNRRPWPTG